MSAARLPTFVARPSDARFRPVSDSPPETAAAASAGTPPDTTSATCPPLSAEPGAPASSDVASGAAVRSNSDAAFPAVSAAVPPSDPGRPVVFRSLAAASEPVSRAAPRAGGTACARTGPAAQGLVYLSDGTEYTSLVQEKLGLPAYDGETMTRLDSEKFEEYKAQAIEELTAAGVTFPVHARYFVAGGNQTTLDSANVLKQAFSDSFGDDFIVLDIDSYVSSFSKEVRDPRLQSFAINGWGADYGDPKTYLGQETDDSDNAYYMVAYGHAVDSESDELKDLYSQFTELVNKADAITDDIDARYEAYADAEVFMLEHALTVPASFDVSWELTHINDYSKMNAIYGIQNTKYKNWETSTDAYTAEDYAAFIETWNENASK